jgi:hypothetical protein
MVKPYKRELDKNSSSNINSPADIISPIDDITSPIDTADNPDYNEENDFLPQFQPPPTKQGRGRSKDSKNRPKTTPTTTFIISKEKVDMELAYQLRAAGRIIIPGKLFKTSDKIEIDALIINNVFRFE